MSAFDEAVESVLADIEAIDDPVQREAAARAALVAVEEARAALGSVRGGAVAGVRDSDGMSYRTLGVVLGLSHARVHRMGTRRRDDG